MAMPKAAAAAVLLLAALAGGCAMQPEPVAAGGSTQRLPKELHWFRNSAERKAASAQAFRLAEQRVRQLAKGLKPGTWGIVTDADETLIDNSEYQKRLALAGETAFNEALWLAWTRERAAPAVPGAQEFLVAVKRLGGRIAVVTNRTQDTCADTEANLSADGLPHDVVLCARDGNFNKNLRFDLIRAGDPAQGLPPQNTVLYVGDNIRDFPGLAQDQPLPLEKFGDAYILLPNPMYGSWEKNPYQ